MLATARICALCRARARARLDQLNRQSVLQPGGTPSSSCRLQARSKPELTRFLALREPKCTFFGMARSSFNDLHVYAETLTSQNALDFLKPQGTSI